jgi:hypothetical protein
MMTQKQADKISENGTDQAQRPEPEVLPQAKRRNFTASYKLWVLEEADKCRQQPGQIGALLRREGLYSSHLTTLRFLRAGSGNDNGKRARWLD